MSALIAAEAPKIHTEATMLDHLARRYGQVHGNGARYAFATHVRSDAGFMAERTADAVAMDLWPSKGNELHGHEVKVSRADWLTELRTPEKATPVRRYCHRWWLVVPDAALVREGELPEGWGLLVLRGSRFIAAVPAPKLRPEPITLGFTAALLRAAVKTEQRRAVR